MYLLIKKPPVGSEIHFDPNGKALRIRDFIQETLIQKCPTLFCLGKGKINNSLQSRNKRDLVDRTSCLQTVYYNRTDRTAVSRCRFHGLVFRVLFLDSETRIHCYLTFSCGEKNIPIPFTRLYIAMIRAVCYTGTFTRINYPIYFLHQFHLS